MLNFMRKNTNSWGMLLLFGIIIVTFALNWGPWGGQDISGVPYAAVVNGQAISMAEFQAAFSNQFNRIKQYRPEFDPTEAEKTGMRSMVLDQLIKRELLTQLGDSYHLKIAPKLLAETIKAQVFRPDEPFNLEVYKQRINGYFQTSVSQFEELVAKDLLAQEMVDLLTSLVNVSESEAKNLYADQETKMALEFVRVDPKNFPAAPDVSKEAALEFVAKNDQKISDYYFAHIGDFQKEEKVRASHILIKVEKTATDAEKQEKKKKAEGILERLKKGEDFATVAKAESEDPGSKIKGGDLDFFTKTAMVEPFANAAFAMKPGDLSEIVESPFGYHIIKVTDKSAAEKKELDAAKPEIAQILLKEEGQNKAAKALAQQALDQLKGGTDISNVKVAGLVNKKLAANKDKFTTSEPIADETPLFSKITSYIAKVGRAGTIGEEAAKLTMKNPIAPEVIESNGLFFAIKLKTRQEADMSKYEEQKEALMQRLKDQRGRSLVEQYLTHMKDTAKIKTNDALMASSGGNLPTEE